MPLLWRLLLVVSTFVCLSSANLDQTSFKGHHAPSKRIAIVGMGAAGVSSLKAIMSLPEDMRAGWEVVAFEQREAVGGLWLPQDEPPSPPEAPATPLYPDLRTNGPHPYQTLPHIPFPPETPLLAPHATVLQYYQDIIIQANLSSYIQLQHAVQRAEWVGNSATGYWDLIVEHVAEGTTSHYQFDHLIAGPGVNRFPTFPVFAGQDEWSAANKTIFHCAYFRDANAFDGQNVVVVGGGPSGWDMVRHLAGHAKKVHWSRDTKADNPAAPGWPPQPGVPDMPRIASLAGGVVTFRDGTVLRDVDTILLATGYDLRIPFLTAGGHLPELDRGAEQSPDYLTSNGRYIYPLYEHTLSLEPTYPLGALYFVGLVLYNPTGMTDYAQALWTAYTLADPRLLASRMELLIALEARESRIRKEGFDPARLGHKVFVGYGAFQGHEENGSHDDLLVHHLRDNGYAGFPGIPPAGVNYTDPWRLEVMRFGAQPVYAWIKGEERVGKQEWNERWSKGRETEEDYVEELKGIMKWWEKVKGSNLTMN